MKIMSNFHRCIQGNPIISCPPVLPLRPTGPTPTACCPCTNLLRNPGFDEPFGVTGPPDWMLEDEFTGGRSHSGRYLSDGTRSVQSVGIRAGGSINQVVPVSEGCCYMLSFAAAIPIELEIVASVSFLPGQSCRLLITPDMNPIVEENIPHIIAVSDLQLVGAFQPYTLVVCTPSGATMACITFQINSLLPTSGFAFIDNVVFENTGGPCPSYEQRF
jgi:hypothetical protein